MSQRGESGSLLTVLLGSERQAECFRVIPSPQDHFRSRTLQRTPRRTDAVRRPIYLFTIQALKFAFLWCKKDSSPGQDNITYAIVAQLPRPSFLGLLKLYKETWEQETLPTAWKNSIVIPIRMPNKSAYDANSYRPIALNSVLCKLIERLVTDMLHWHMETDNQFKRFQSGFCKLRGCQDQIIRLQGDIQRAIYSKFSVTGLFVDLEKAFDLMWTYGLLHKLQQ